jgi:hypothetical protein
MLLRGEVPEPYALNDEQQNSFADLYERVLGSSVGTSPDGELVLDTDASDEQLGCWFQQRGDDENLHPLGYWLRQLNPAEVNYSATKEEALPVVWSIKVLKPYLEGQEFIVRTDHAAFTWLFSDDGDNRCSYRWR